MKPPAFDYFAATDLPHAMHLLKAAGEDARILAGGQSLVPMMNFRVARPSALIDISQCKDLTYIRVADQAVCIGAAVRQVDAQFSPVILAHCPLLALALSHAGPLTVRNSGTVGGSLANGYPLAHLVCAAICLDAEIVLANEDGNRSVAARDFFVDAMETDLGPFEILVESRFPVLAGEDGIDFRQLANHTGGAATCMLATHAARDAAGAVTGVRVALSGLSGSPVRLAHVEAALCGTPDAAALAIAYTQDLAALDYDASEADDAQRYTAHAGLQLVRDAAVALGLSEAAHG